MKDPLKEASMHVDPNISVAPSELFRRAARAEIELGHADRGRLSPDQLFALAITNRLTLSRADLDRIRPIHLAHLALAEKIALESTDRRRIPVDLLYLLYIEGYVALVQDELSRFTPAQRAEIVRRRVRNASRPESLQPIP
jgi:hypothetical protein